MRSDGAPGEDGGGLFITFEGPEGGGKSTQVHRQASRLAARGVPVVVTREPGGTPIGERIRDVLLDPTIDHMRAATEAMLFCAARSELVADVIRPALASGSVVLCDRFSDATMVYQGHAGGADLGWLRDLNRAATGGLEPDLTVLLDLEPEVGLARRRGLEWTRLDAADIAFHRRVREGYLARASAEPDRFVVVAADRPRAGVDTAVDAAVDGLLTKALGRSPASAQEEG